MILWRFLRNCEENKNEEGIVVVFPDPKEQDRLLSLQVSLVTKPTHMVLMVG